MKLNSHGKTVCKLCEITVTSCRCCTNGKKDTEETICDSCTKIVDKATGIKMHLKYKNFMFGVPMFDIPMSVLKAIHPLENADEIMDDLMEWLDDKFWVCHKRGVAEKERELNG